MGSSELIALTILLAAIAVIVVMAFSLFAITYSILTRRLTRRLDLALSKVEQAVAAGHSLLPEDPDSIVPPMRIHLEFDKEDPRVFGILSSRLEEWFLEQGFHGLGQFIIEELQGERLRAYAHRKLPILAALRLPSGETLPYVEFSIVLDDTQLAGVANPPAATVQLPDDAVGKYFFEPLAEDLRLLDRMWDEICEMATAHPVQAVPKEPIAFAELYEQAHAYEMDFRMRTGGLTTKEIISSFQQQGVRASKSDVALIQQRWQDAIEKHLLDFSSRASNHYYAGRNVLIVYEGSQQSYLIARMTHLLKQLDNIDPQQRKQLVDCFSELRVLLDRFSPREAMARFRPLLPREIRYDLVDQLECPIEADCYVLPSV